MFSIRKYGRIISLLIVVICMAVSCSTTKRLGEGEVLYTGVNHINISTTEGEKLNSDLVSEIKGAVDVAPNNPMPFMSPYVRTPFPIGLWVYNNWNDSAKGIEGWLYDKLVAMPVLVSDVRPDARVKMIEEILDNNGYFASTAKYELEYNKKNPKKARVNYAVSVSKPYLIDSIIYFNDRRNPTSQFVDSLLKKSEYLRVGEKFCTDSLISVRTVVANRMRNRGYYFFRPEYIEFLADTMVNPGGVTLKLAYAASTPQAALRQYKTGNVEVNVLRANPTPTDFADTIDSPQAKVVVMRPTNLDDNLVPSCITFKKGRLFAVREMDRTQTRLSRLGIFSAIDIQAVPRDTALRIDTLDLVVNCRMDQPMEATIEVNVASKSNSYLGPGVSLGLTHHNIFGGAEKLSVVLDATYEWQTGRNKSSLFNSYEFGLTSSLSFPRLLAPKFIPRSQREMNWTTISLSGRLLNRPHYFKMAQFETGISYEWRATRNTRHTFTPFKLAYTKLINTTSAFDSIMQSNPAIALSFQSQFIPKLSYSYTLDKYLEREKINRINFTATLTEAGNIFDGIYTLCGAKGEKHLFGTPFSQFVKGTAQVVYSRRLVPRTEHWLVVRASLGAAHAYRNSQEVPYAEQFYIGGANSIRAFTVRSIGPGSYRAPQDQVNGYFDQTGTFKVELNAEYRFPLFSVIHGAVFLDAGNIWLLKDDPQRPGGLLKGSTFLKDLALGTGIGLRCDLGMIVVRGDLGYGLHAPYNTGSSHYFNIPFKNAFAFHLAIGYPF